MMRLIKLERNVIHQQLNRRSVFFSAVLGKIVELHSCVKIPLTLLFTPFSAAPGLLSSSLPLFLSY